ncbi:MULTISPECIES: hybrid sensor histidine kinase/response regulator [Dyella]|uniref:histidine kinase n=2 Tax=Dyella TaxID=231454 RepID=A0A4R0YZY0_9GAMM|nr:MULTISPECIES: PAS domain-containing sensor histidine kinase [Dyella]TBR39491.1 PAS domain-containing sensor histidine kinase [Dyella terrae]TCI12924.1 PAS domain-containing sensor histidine kinase [Dyella soli]
MSSGLLAASPVLGSDADRFRLLVQSVVDYAIYMLDPGGHIASWNLGAQQIKGYSAEEVLGRHFSMFYTPEDREQGKPQEALGTAAREGRFHGEAWRLRKDGSRFRALVVIDAIRDVDGSLIGFAKVTRDITARWEALNRLEESERRFRLLVEGVPDYAICMLDEQRLIQHWNSGARHITGYDRQDVMGRPVHSLLALEERANEEAMDAAYDRAVSVGTYEADYWHRRKDGSSFLAHILIRPLRDSDGVLRGYAQIIRDVSEQRAAEEELESTRQQLFEAQKLEALGQLTGGVAHDFNNIMQAVMGSLEIARARLKRGDGEAAGTHIDHAIRSVERGAQLTKRLLAYARRQPLMATCVDLNKLVASMVDMIERTVGMRVRLQFEPTEGELLTVCDANQLETALLNLCINGRDAMPDGGRLTISTRRGVSSHVPHDWVGVAVSDTGVGMTREIMERVFDPFFTTKPLGQGTGLGLSIVQSFAAQSQGAVNIQSSVGVGTSIEIRLPRYTPGAEEAIGTP